MAINDIKNEPKELLISTYSELLRILSRIKNLAGQGNNLIEGITNNENYEKNKSKEDIQNINNMKSICDILIEKEEDGNDA